MTDAASTASSRLAARTSSAFGTGASPPAATIAFSWSSAIGKTSAPLWMSSRRWFFVSESAAASSWMSNSASPACSCSKASIIWPSISKFGSSAQTLRVTLPLSAAPADAAAPASSVAATPSPSCGEPLSPPQAAKSSAPAAQSSPAAILLLMSMPIPPSCRCGARRLVRSRESSFFPRARPSAGRHAPAPRFSDIAAKSMQGISPRRSRERVLVRPPV